jgi:hypothetical protein
MTRKDFNRLAEAHRKRKYKFIKNGILWQEDIVTGELSVLDREWSKHDQERQARQKKWDERIIKITGISLWLGIIALLFVICGVVAYQLAKIVLNFIGG